MKRILRISVICLFSIILMLLIYYFYIQYQAYIYWRQNEVPSVKIEWVDTTKIYTVGELLEIPKSELKNVKKLDLRPSEHRPQGDKGYSAFPPILSQLNNLEYIDFSWNEISDLKPIQHLNHLKKIILSKNQIKTFDGLKNFGYLNYLDISGNQLVNLGGLEELHNLQFLNLLWNNNLSDIKGIEQLTKLENLMIGYNKLDSFPIEILQLKNLKKLSMDNLHFTSFPDSFYTAGLPIEMIQMKNMSSFDYRANLPKIHKLKKLRELYLSWNNIPVLAINFQKCENLELFSYTYNVVIIDARYYTGQLPLGNYWNYKDIDVEDILNRVSKAPKLKNLNLSNNNIRYLPENILLPDSLEVLNLSNNKLKRLPIDITKYKKLKYIQLYNNPIDTIAIKEMERMMSDTKFYYDK